MLSEYLGSYRFIRKHFDVTDRMHTFKHGVRVYLDTSIPDQTLFQVLANHQVYESSQKNTAHLCVYYICQELQRSGRLATSAPSASTEDDEGSPVDRHHHHHYGWSSTLQISLLIILTIVILPIFLLQIYACMKK